MPPITENEKKKIIDLINSGKPLPTFYKSKLFAADDVDFVEATRDYRLVYKGKARKEEIIANTPVAPLQEMRTFNSNNNFEGGWSNMLIFGDNLFALKTIYEDQQGPNKFKTKNRIKLIYIDPPFATKHDFMKDREKAYRDKIIGAQFIEFLRKRLILMREILAYDGSIYVHLDWKKGHYIKVIMDEIFGEHNFINEIVWYYRGGGVSSENFGKKHDTIFLYKKLHQPQFNLDDVRIPYSEEILSRPPSSYLKAHRKGGTKIYEGYTLNPLGKAPDDVFEIPIINPEAQERHVTGKYPTQKPEKLLERIIKAFSRKGDIVLDAFAGSGSTLTVSEKLERRWIGMDSGKLAIYTIQKRMLNLTTHIGAVKKDERRDYKRVDDFEEHFKKSRGLLFVYEKARRGDLVITDTFLKNLADLISNNLSGDKKESFSLVCPEEKLKIRKLKVVENEEGKVGEKVVTVGRIKFFISFIQPKEKTEKVKRLKAKEFTLYNAGIYDNKQILNMAWEHYHPFVAQLFDVRLEPHKIRGFTADGYIGTNSAYIWEYPKHKKLVLDEKYVETLHDTLGGRAGEKFYIIAPICAMGFMQDEIVIGKTTYVFLKVPLSVLMALIEKGEPGALKQPASESDVNEVIDAIGFDFISQPVVQAKYLRKKPEDKNLFNKGKKDYVIEISKFLSQKCPNV